jgi:hypothetical protein
VDGVVQDVGKNFRLYFSSSDWLHPRIVPHVSGRRPLLKGGHVRTFTSFMEEPLRRDRGRLNTYNDAFMRRIEII